MSGKVRGEIVAVDASGNLVSDITERQLDGVPRDESVTVSCDGHKTVGIYPLDHRQPEMTLLAMLNAEGQLSLALVGESAEAFLGIRKGSVVEISW